MEKEDERICGWELANLDPANFDVRIVDILGECQGCRHRVECLTPADSMRELVPKHGRIVHLTSQQNESGECSVYFAFLTEGRDAKFIELKQSQHCWATAQYLAREDLPPRVLAKWCGQEVIGSPNASRTAGCDFGVSRPEAHLR